MFKRYIKPVYAHCDIPCGIYETDTMRHAAETCMRMVEKIEALGELDSQEKWNNFTRMVAVKEEHAQKVKHEAYVLWSDYFKEKHLEMFPSLHDVIWQLTKHASVVKQSIDKQACELLQKNVDDVADMFEQSK